jgi:uncharacterized membrane protein
MTQSTSDVTSDDKLWAALAYFFSPFVPLIIMFAMPDKKDRPFIKAHNAQALVLGALNWIVAFFLSWLVIPVCLNIILGLYQLFCTIKAYQGETISIPVVTDFCKNQGWA